MPSKREFTVSSFISSDQIVNGNPLLDDFKWSNKTFDVNYFQLSDAPCFIRWMYLQQFSRRAIPTTAAQDRLTTMFTINYENGF